MEHQNKSHPTQVRDLLGPPALTCSVYGRRLGLRLGLGLSLSITLGLGLCVGVLVVAVVVIVVVVVTVVGVVGVLGADEGRVVSVDVVGLRRRARSLNR